MSTAPLSLEAIRLHLIENKSFSVLPHQRQQVSLEELIEYLVDSFESSDPASRDKAEAILARIGRPTVPYLLKGLKSSNLNIKSSCAMSLIRMGDSIIDDVKSFYARTVNAQKLAWVVEFILNELGETIPELDYEALDYSEDNVLVLSQAS